ncbi:hypothetical protein GCM10027599_21360 [Yimella radicis]
MAMNDEETVALIAGGHTFGKTHGAAEVGDHLGPDTEAAGLENQGLGWKNSFGTGHGDDTITSGLEVTWTYHPTRWDNEFFHILYAYDWELFHSPAGAQQWRPKNGGGDDMVPMAHDPSKRREPRMLTSDLALRFDPEYDKISRKFKDDQDAFADAFARAWFKLTHRDMGPRERYVGPEVPGEELLWQDPVPANELGTTEANIAAAKQAIEGSGLTVQQLVKTAWAAASSFRASDKRGGANGGRIRLEPQRSWEANDPAELSQVIPVLEKIASENNLPAEYALLDRSNLLTLTPGEMTVLLAGLRGIGANTAGSKVGVLTDREGALTNDFLVTLLDLETSWERGEGDLYNGKNATSGATFTGSRADLVFGANSELRAVAEVYASDGHGSRRLPACRRGPSDRRGRSRSRRRRRR